MISNKLCCLNGKAAFYACILEDLKIAASKCGWALGLHGSLANDMDIMAMPWTENAVSAEAMIQSLSDCFVDNPFKNMHTIPYYNKPNNRVVYTISIWKDFYLDINIIKTVEYNVRCSWCGEVYKGHEFCCPRCQQQESEELEEDRI